jgi:hypothetical protein
MATWAIHVLDQAKHTTTNLPPIEDTRYSTLFILLQIFIHQSIDQQQAVLDCPNLLATTIGKRSSMRNASVLTTPIQPYSAVLNKPFQDLPLLPPVQPPSTPFHLMLIVDLMV